MRSIRTALIAAVAAVGLVMSTGTAHAVFSDEVLLTAAEAQAAMAYPTALTQENLPMSTPGVLMRTFKGAGTPPDAFTVLVSDPQGSGGSEGSKAQAEKAESQAKNNYPGLECKVYEQSGDKVTIVCWANDPAMVVAFSADMKKYYKQKRVKGKIRNVLYKSLPVLGTVTRLLMAPESEDESASVQVTEADRVRAANEAKGLRNAQVAKLPATYQ